MRVSDSARDATCRLLGAGEQSLLAIGAVASLSFGIADSSLPETLSVSVASRSTG